MVNTRTFESNTETYVLLSQCEYVFYSEVLCKLGCSFVVRYDPRGWHAKYIVIEGDDIEEDDDVEGHEVDVLSNEKFEEDEWIDVDDNVIDDDIYDNGIIENRVS